MQFVLTNRLTFISILLLGLSACGGGGSDAKPSQSENPSSSTVSSSSIAPLAAQNFAFSQGGPLNLQAGDVLTNQAVGNGNGVVTYVSSNTDVATVDTNGLVKIVGMGDSIITASKAADSKYLAATASYTIHAVSVNQTFSFAQSGQINLLAGASLANPAIGQGKGAIRYHSSNTDVATVDNNGLVNVIVVGAGTTVITAIKEADSYYNPATASYAINASGANQTLSFAQPGSLHVLANTTLTNVATGQGSSPVIYSSSNTKVAVVDASGQVNVVGGGNATITAFKAADNRYLEATNSYTLYSQLVNFVNKEPLAGVVGVTLFNQASGEGIGAITYSSSDTNVASVDSSGRVTLLNEGSAVITANKAADTNYLSASASYTAKAARSSQNVTFANTGPVNLLTGDTLTNPATAQSTGAISYSSSDINVVTVDNNGVATVVGGGTAIITAKAAADTRYLSAESSYTINANVPVAAWVGSNDTLVNFSATMAGMEFYRSNIDSCDLANYLSCTNGQMNLLNSSIITDSAARLDRTGYYVLKNGNQQANLTLKVDINDPLNNIYAPFTARSGSQTFVFNNKIWMIGGSTFIKGNSEYKNDIWSSSDGITWTQEVANAPFAARADHKVLIFNNKLWLIGGNQSGLTSDTWSSQDGINWIKEANNTSDAVIYANYAHTLIVYNNKIWLVGRYDSIKREPTNEIWSSTDGKTWVQETNAAFPARSNGTVVVYNNQLWLIGGGLLNDVWSSTDGITWIQQSANTAFSARSRHTVTEYNNKLWLIGGLSSDGWRNDVWSSADGITWTQHIATAPFTPRWNHAVINYKNHLMLLGGSSISLGIQVNDTWISTDGTDWRVGYRGIFKFSQ